MGVLQIDGVEAVLRSVSSPDAIIDAMDERAERDGFPTIGPEVGMVLRWCVNAHGVERVFECGSGFGYSAYWMATELPSDGDIVLTEIDRDELADAEETFQEAGLDALARFEHGDALEILEADSTTYDLILLDHENERYTEGFELAAERLTPNGLIVADNVLHSWEFTPAMVASRLRGEDHHRSASLDGIVDYIEHASSHPDFQTCIIPVGEGLGLSVRTESASSQ